MPWKATKHTQDQVVEVIQAHEVQQQAPPHPFLLQILSQRPQKPKVANHVDLTFQ